MLLTATDNGDDTGGSIAVSGNAGTASIYVSRFLGSNASRAFTLAGTVVGNGTLSLPGLELGPHIALGINAVPDMSVPVFFRITDGVEALHYRCLEAVREYIMSLALPTVSNDPDDHVVVKMPFRPDLELNIETSTDCCIMYFPKAETYTGANNEEDSVAYSVQVLLIRSIGQRLFQGLPAMLKDRELIGQSMSMSPMPDLEEIHTVQVQPGAVYMPEHWIKKYDCSNIVFRCLTEQRAGIF